MQPPCVATAHRHRTQTLCFSRTSTLTSRANRGVSLPLQYRTTAQHTPITPASRADGNAGFWIARTQGGAAERLIRRWWDVSDPEAGRAWPFEQNAVGALRRARDGLHTTVCVPYDQFFGFGPQSYVHHPVDKPAGQPGFRLALASIGLDSGEAFSRVAHEMLASSAIQSLDIDATQSEMAARSAKDPRFYKTCEKNLQCKDDKYE